MSDYILSAPGKSVKITHASNILLKNLPKNGDKLIGKLIQMRPTPTNIKSFGRRRALITFSSETDVHTALNQIQELVKESKIRISLFPSYVPDREHQAKSTNSEVSLNIPQHVRMDVNAQHLAMASCRRERIKRVPKFTQTSSLMAGLTIMPSVNNYVRDLYSCNSRLNFEQPPPPYLWYSYPKITSGLLNSITIALMNNRSFGTQVLHLMNRMNLEPPFEPKVLPQTSSLIGRKTMITQKPEKNELGVETTENESNNILCTRIVPTVKRKQPLVEDQLKKKPHLLVRGASSRKIRMPSVHSCKASIDFNISTVRLEPPKVTLNLMHNAKRDPQESRKWQEEATPSPSTNHIPVFEPTKDSSQQRLSVEEMQELPAFKNYSEGEPSYKLYIKNLSKNVCVADLKELYANFANSEHLNIKVMQQGRMRGQAFVEFKNLRECDYESVVGQALRKTNGFMLKQKPIIVCYGKK